MKWLTLLLLCLSSAACTLLRAQNAGTESWRASWQVPGQELSGLIVCQKQDSSGARLVMINELGVKYFDAFVGPDSVNLRYLLPPLARNAYLPFVKRAVYLAGIGMVPDIQPAPDSLQVRRRGDSSILRMTAGPGSAKLRKAGGPPPVCRVKSYPIKCNFTLEKLPTHAER